MDFTHRGKHDRSIERFLCFRLFFENTPMDGWMDGCVRWRAGVGDGRIRYDDDGIGDGYARDVCAGDVYDDEEDDDDEDDGGASMRRSASRQW